MLRVRITFSKTEAMRFTGHLDLHRAWARTIRRARAPLAYTRGFRPHPRIQLGAALPLGFTSDCEVVDVWLEHELPLGELRAALEKAAPPGIKLRRLETVDLRAPALQTQIISAGYEARLLDPLPMVDLERRVADLLARPAILRTRRKKEYDLRPLIESLTVSGPDGPPASDPDRSPALKMTLAAREGATGRPEEVLDALGLNPHLARIRRTTLTSAPV